MKLLDKLPIFFFCRGRNPINITLEKGIESKRDKYLERGGLNEDILQLEVELESHNYGLLESRAL